MQSTEWKWNPKTKGNNSSQHKSLLDSSNDNVRQLHFGVPGTAPTAPNAPESPSMILASHSTWPSSVKFEPCPAFVLGSSFKETSLIKDEIHSGHTELKRIYINISNKQSQEHQQKSLTITLDSQVAFTLLILNHSNYPRWLTNQHLMAIESHYSKWPRTTTPSVNIFCSQLALFAFLKRMSHSKTKWVIDNEFPLLTFHFQVTSTIEVRKATDQRVTREK